MASFAQAFWSPDYAGGLGVLFAKLQQGVQENLQVLTIARMRADAEELYGQHMRDIGPACDRYTDGFARDDGASVRKAYDGMRTEMDSAGDKHRKIADNIRELVVYPFGRWCEQHATRVQSSQDELHSRIKAHDKQADSVRKLRSHYFNKCRLVEDLEEEDKLAFKEPMVSPPVASPKADTPTVRVSEPDEDEEDEAFEIGDDVFQRDQMRKILTHMLESVRLGETKVPILGTYQNTTSGSEIVEYIQKHMNGSSMSYSERIGQDLIKCGFLRLVGNVGSVFANSSRMNYQWRPKAFKLTGLPEKRTVLGRSSTVMSTDSMGSMGIDSPIYNNVTEYLAGLNPLNNPYPNETPGQKLRREAREADERYKLSVKKLDTLRCNLEEAMIEHLKFMERCELDRLKAVKSVILDFSGAISNTIPSLQSTVDKMMLFQETVQPLGDLRYLLENYRTGPFVPRVQPYENYYNSVDEQTFGVDLEARARADKKRVPLVVTTILMHLDNNYPLLDGDEARRSIWTVDVPLASTHKLRAELNTGINPPPSAEVLSKHDIPVVASCLKLYLLELPDSLVSSGLYEIIKTVYSSPATSGTDEQSAHTRVNVIQNTLGQLRLANIATLDAITTHFCRMIDLTSADEEYVQNLTQGLAPCILRSRTESSMLFGEKYNVRFVRDLFNHKETIFNELKRNATLQHSASVLRANSTATVRTPVDTSRQRAISTDESNRRAHMEERNRAIASRSRAGSPTRGSRDHGHGSGGPTVGHDGHHRLSNPAGMARPGHRRDSSRGPETRFPVATPAGAANSPRSATRVSRPGDRDSLEVPTGDAPTIAPTAALASAASTPVKSSLNGAGVAASAAGGAPAVPAKDSPDDFAAPRAGANGHVSSNSGILADADGAAISKSDSLGRRAGVVRKAPGSGSVGSRSSLQMMRDSAVGSEVASGPAEGERRGVELVDRPMDD